MVDQWISRRLRSLGMTLSQGVGVTLDKTTDVNK